MFAEGNNSLVHSSLREVVGLRHHLQFKTNLSTLLSFPRPPEAENKAGGVWLKGHTGNSTSDKTI
ncbi:hypothetical protein Ac2012v2_004278 [Leucoagaricus gongylophorus]